MEDSKSIPSHYPFEKVMEAIAELQGEKSAIVILQADNGGTSYLRYKISEEDTVNLLKSAYSERNVVNLEENPAEMEL